MASVVARPGESFESLMRRFKRAVERSGVLSELKLKEYYEKPSQKKKRKQAAARKREAKRLEKVGKFFKGNANFRFSKDHKTKIPLVNNRKPQGKNYYQSKPNNSSSQGKPNYNQNNKPSYNQNNKPNYNQNRKPYYNKQQNYNKNTKPNKE